MKIAIPLEDGRVGNHFGHCTTFGLYEIDDASREIVNQSTLTAPKHEPGVLPRWLHECGAEVVIAGSMGPRAMALLTHQNIQVVMTTPDQLAVEAVKAYLDDTLAVGSNACHHGDGEHQCQH